MSVAGVQPLPAGPFFRIIPYGSFLVASSSSQRLKCLPWEIQHHGIRNIQLASISWWRFVHKFLSLIVSPFSLHPRTVTNSFPFSTLPPFKYLESRLISRLESPLGTTLCLWFLLPLLINRTPEALIASSLPSSGKRGWAWQGWMQRPRGGFRMKLMKPYLPGPLTYLSCFQGPVAQSKLIILYHFP